MIILPDKAKQLLEASTCITKVSDCLAGWEDDFQVPLQYSTATMVNFGKGCLNSLATLLKMGSRSDNLCVNVATKYTSYICIHGAAVANLCC